MYVNTLITLQENLSTYGIDGKKVTGHVTITSPGLIKCYVQNLKKQIDGRTYAFYAFSKTKDKGIRLGSLSNDKETKWIIDGKNIGNAGINLEELDGVAIVVEDEMRGADTILIGFKSNRYMIIPLIDEIYKKRLRPGNPSAKADSSVSSPVKPGGLANPSAKASSSVSSPVKLVDSATSSVKASSPVSSPVKLGDSATSSAKADSSVSSPVKPGGSATSSAKASSPVSSPVKLGEPVNPSAKADSPVSSPVKLGEPVNSSAKADSPVSSPVELGEPVNSSVKASSSANSSAEADSLVSLLAKLGDLANSSAKASSSVSSPVKTGESVNPFNQSDCPGNAPPRNEKKSGIIVEPDPLQEGVSPITIPSGQQGNIDEQDFKKIEALDKQVDKEIECERLEDIDIDLLKIAEKLQEIGKKPNIKQGKKSDRPLTSSNIPIADSIREEPKPEHDEVSRELQRIINMLKENQEVRQKTKGIEEQIEKMRKLPQNHKLAQKSNLEKTLESRYMAQQLTGEEEEELEKEESLDTCPKNALNFISAEAEGIEIQSIVQQNSEQVEGFEQKESANFQDEIDYIGEIDKKIREIESRRRQQESNRY